MLEYLGYVLYKKQENDKIEGFSSSSDGIMILFLSLVISFLCIYLSWSCNTRLGLDTGLKLLYAFFAWFFGILYLFFYFFVNVLGRGCGI